MNGECIRLTVIGKPEPRGSKVAQPLYDDERDDEGNKVIDAVTGRTRKKPRLDSHGRVMTYMRDDNPASGPWMKKVRAAAERVMGNRQPVKCPVKLYIRFYLERPMYHFGTGRNAGLLKDGYRNAAHIVRPDRLKLARAIEDALSEVWYVDDAQTIGGEVQKMYVTPGEEQRVEIEMHLPPVREGATVQRSLIV